MKNKRFWPEQIEEARTLAVQEKKFLTREYDAVLDADGNSGVCPGCGKEEKV